ncbi:LysR family transcriptional regulator [Opitutaceae bacterium TAV4]|nr:LysR family transcriptional regulator [Opitutaceae bacterium TAV4]RRK00147.1 LysR family transcriptional regulator [Opitutaceae bacterium TAV3]
MFEKLFSERGLSLDRMRVLVEVHDAGSIAQAAPGDPIRQSQYSRQLRELSEFFGCEVAQRQGKLLKLTGQGRRLADLAREHFRSLEDFRAECAAESLDYMIAAGDSLLHWLVIPRLGALVAGKQPVRFATIGLRTNDVVQYLSDVRADFGVIRQDAVTAALDSAPLGELGYVAVVPKALIGRGKTPMLKDVIGQLPLASQTADGQFTQRVRQIADSFKVEFRPALACQSFPQTVSAVRSGGFAAILPSLALAELPTGTYVSVIDPTLKRLKRKLALVWNPRVRQVRSGASRLIGQLKDALRVE